MFGRFCLYIRFVVLCISHFDILDANRGPLTVSAVGSFLISSHNKRLLYLYLNDEKE